MEKATALFETRVDLLRSFLEPRGISREVAVRYRLGCGSDELPGWERFDGMLSIPYLTPAGVVALKFRCLRDHDCKAADCQRYDAPDGQKARLFNAGSLARGGDVAVVVEGELKAITVESTFGVPTVATSAGVWFDHWPRTLVDFERVMVVADNDEAGLKHARGKVLKSLPNGVLVVPPSDHPKVDDWIAECGPEAAGRLLGL